MEGKGVYTVNGARVPRISTVAKVGEDVWRPASAWGWRLGFEGAHEVLGRYGSMSLADLEAELLRSNITPWAKRDKAADRGTDVHDVLEALVMTGQVPELPSEAERLGHALSLVRWYRRFKPSFVASEVIVGSAVHGFAGRYDFRALFEVERLLRELDARSAALLAVLLPLDVVEGGGELLGLCDLKTSKRVIPRVHFAQLDGYEEGSVECGYPATDFRAVVKTHADGTPADFTVSWAPRGMFVAYLGAVKAMEALDWHSPVARERREKAARYHAQEVVVLQGLQDHGPITRNKLAVKLRPWQPEQLGKVLQRLKAQGKAKCAGRTWEAACDTP